MYDSKIYLDSNWEKTNKQTTSNQTLTVSNKQTHEYEEEHFSRWDHFLVVRKKKKKENKPKSQKEKKKK